jgi:hypothetical protein
MRIQKTVFVVGVLLLTVFFITGVANAAPNMSQWLGKWFSYTVTMKGIEIQSDGSGVTKSSSKETGYFKIWGWDGENFQIDSYYLDNGAWQSDSLTLQFIAGNNLTFLFVLKQGTDEFYEFACLMQGKEKNAVLSSATVTTYGGFILDTDTEDNDVGAGNISLAAKMVAESKVKVPSNVIQH